MSRTRSWRAVLTDFKDTESGQALADVVSTKQSRRVLTMDIHDLFPSNFLKAVDLKGQARQAVITDVAPEDMGSGETKPVARFSGLDRGLVLNKTNSMLLAAHFGNETTGWIGKTIEMYSEKVSFQGRIVNAIRVRVPVPPAQTAPAQPEATPTGDFNDDIPDWG